MTVAPPTTPAAPPVRRAPSARRPIVRLLAAVAAAAPVVLAAFTARADSFVDKVNGMYAVMLRDGRSDTPLPQSMRSDLILLPAVAGMQPPPAAVADPSDAVLLPPTSRDWAAVVAWAQSAPQRAVLDALAKVTDDEGAESHMVFAQPYGVEGVSVELVGADLYTELGDPPTLAAADFKYLEGLQQVMCLAHVEANRLAAEGKTPEAMEVMIDWLWFSRQMADRVLLKEKAWGMLAMGVAMEHLRDLAYRDSRAQTHTLTIDKLTDIVKRLDDRKSPLGIERILLPAGDRIAAEQLLRTVYDTSTGAPSADSFGARLARITTGDRPLRLFSEAARWDQLRGASAKWLAINEANGKLAADYQYRWGLRAHDSVLSTENDFKRTVAGKPAYAVLAIVYGPYDRMFGLRQELRTDAAGLRTSLAAYAYQLRNGQPATAVTSLRPIFMPSVDQDPYDPQGRPLSYFVPIRDTPAGPRGEKSPHEMNVFPGGRRFKPFAVKLGDPSSAQQDEFILYSVGPDADRGWAHDVCADGQTLKEGDYLLWPPLVSLLRQHLVQEGQLQ